MDLLAGLFFVTDYFLLSVLVLGLFLLFSGKSWAAEFEPVSYTAYTSLFWLKEAGVPEAADLMPGPVCITMDGLMMYLTHEQQASVLQNIKAILQKHGGCYITTDFSARDFVMDASKVVYGAKHAREVYRESAKVYEDITDADFDEKFLANDEEATRFITAQGVKVQRIPLFSQPTTLYSEKGLDKQQLQRLDSMKNAAIVWLITCESRRMIE
ncbi:MAG: hypothetical protein K6F01_08200 [Selenomonas sp.]|uniref:hypothetical protein n=1 Tax=Selenomonas sp. TaxID=2053611 RepID=UPI0025F6E8EA|nr:hypothetical protein [Selenomonas sp.]MCR5439393.1 hypothetical protein [Selenomonas sp.]